MERQLPLRINSEVVIASGVIGILLIMVMPIPTQLLDVLLCLSISLSLIIILVTVYCLRPLQFSVFPSILLVATLYRLSLNVASTRLILLHGSEGEAAAGQVIKAFGQFVVGGNYVVGIVVFLILVTINFIVITRGAGRIAEVAARFVLDAMPGKQMSIDADLNAGLVTEAEARKRRREISSEADFYGAMDGASKFVRGDAIAGIVITLINIIGGLIIGVVQEGLPIQQAVQYYTILTVGDGLISQIPALIISTAAGLLVSRAASESQLGTEMIRQLTLHPKAVGLTAGILLLLGLMPGLPHVAFLVLSAAVGCLAFTTHRAEVAQREAEARQKRTAAPAPEQVETLLPLDVLELEVGYGLIPLVNVEQGGDLLDRIRSIRRQFATDMGIIVPPLHIRDNLDLKPGEYTILLKGIEVARGELMLGHCLAMRPGTVEMEVEGIETREPTFGMPALWVNESERERARLAGYTVVDLSTVIATHLTEVIRRHSAELLGRQETQHLLDNVSRTHPKVVEELVPNLLSVGAVQRVLQRLLRERVSVRDLLTILEVLTDYAALTKDPDILVEYVRQGLARSITNQYLEATGALYVLSLDPKLEEAIAEAIERTEQGAYLALDPRTVERLVRKLREAAERCAALNHQAILLTTPGVRGPLRRVIECFLPDLTVLSHGEVVPHVTVHSVGVVSLDK